MITSSAVSPSSGGALRSTDAAVRGEAVSTFVRNCSNCPPKWLLHFPRPPLTSESSGCSTTLPAFGAVSALDFGQSHRCVMASHCRNLQFPTDMCYRVFSYATCCLHMFFWEVSGTIFRLLFNWAVHFIVEFYNFLAHFG